MLSLILSSVRHNRGRYVATLVAILTGVAFYTATGLIGDRVTNSLEGDAETRYANVDVAIVPQKEAGSLGGAGDQLRLSGKSADNIAAVSGVDATGGELTGAISLARSNGRPFATDATGRLWISDGPLNPLAVDEGRAPQAANEIAVDRGLADDYDLKVGQTVGVLSLAGPSQATIVGTTKFGGSDAIDEGGTISLPESRAFAALTAGKREYDEFYVRGSAAQSAIKQEVAPLVGTGFQAETGEQFIQEKKDDVGSVGTYLKRALQGFAILALLVGGFVIYNTFTVIFAQRLRELAVLSAIGATPKQLGRMLMLEGLVIGLVGSALGVISAIVIIGALFLILDAVGSAIPGSGLGLSASTIVSGIFLGTVITLLSVRAPARKAAKIEPIEAMRSASVEPASLPRSRMIWSIVLGVFGVAGMLFGGGPAVIGVAAICLFAAAIISAPYVAIGAAKLARPGLSRVGLEGRLAVDNVARSPRRTATTANALLIGVFLVTLVTVTGTNLKDYVVGVIDSSSSADYLVQSQGGTIDAGLVKQFEAIPDVNRVAPFQRIPVTIDGVTTGLSAGDLKLVTKVANVPLTAGSLDDLKAGTIAVNPGTKTYKLGQTVKVVDADGNTANLKVAAVVDTASIDGKQLGSLVSAETMKGLAGPTPPTVAFMDVKTGSESETKDAINAVADRRPDVTVAEGNAVGKLISGVFDFVIKAVDLLLMMSVLIALIGIINTLSLAIIERRRELGLLRVVGMTDPLVQRMVRLEAVLIAVIGTVSGLVLGLFSGWATIQAINRLSDVSLPFSFPIATILIVLGLGIVLGVLAALIPARRSTKMAVLEAIDG